MLLYCELNPRVVDIQCKQSGVMENRFVGQARVSVIGKIIKPYLFEHTALSCFVFNELIQSVFQILKLIQSQHKVHSKGRVITVLCLSQWE